MNFFQQQDQTKKTTQRLLFLFGLSILAIATLNYFALQFYLSTTKIYTQLPSLAENKANVISYLRFDWFDPKIFMYTLGATILLILIVSWFKHLSLNKGGQSVAEMMGGRRIVHDTQDFQERKLLNIVEEMALASGIPVPDVYLIEESAINAFAAGHSVQDAVIGVTKGSIEKLSREELQGVIAHEFSHIFHGDIKINLYLISLLHGILFLHYMGRFALRSSRGSSSRSSRRGGNGGAFVLGGLALLVIGYVGYFFGRLIQSAVSRQREFLADASAVQYTRNPHGIAGALYKIGGFTDTAQTDSILSNDKSAQIQHMMFSISILPSFFSLFATHPPIGKRIQAIDPSFDVSKGAPSVSRIISDPETLMGLASSTQASSHQPGRVHQGLLRQANTFLEKLEPAIYKACHHPQKAKALLYLLAIEDNQTQFIQVQSIISKSDPYLLSTFTDLHPLLKQNHIEHRIELFDLCMPSLRRLSKSEYGMLTKTLLKIVQLDQQVSLSEWIFIELIKTHLHAYFYPKKQTVLYSRELDMIEDIRILFSALAYAGQESQIAAQSAFDKGFSIFKQPETTIIEKGRLDLSTIAGSFEKVKHAHPMIKTKMVQSIQNVVLSDEKIQWDEFELYRAFSDGLGNPIPPMLRK